MRILTILWELMMFLANMVRCRYMCIMADKPMLEDPQQNMTMSCGFPYAYKGAQAVQDGQALSLIGYEIKVLHTPGHTPGGCCYYIASEHVLISGDTLFQQSIGRTDFPGGSMSDLVRAVKEKLMILAGGYRGISRTYGNDHNRR